MKHTSVTIEVIMRAVTYSFESAAPQMRELPSANFVGKYFPAFGMIEIRYEVKMTAPVPISTPVTELDITENITMSDIVKQPNIHQTMAEYPRL